MCNVNDRIWDNLNIAVIVSDPEFNVTYVNKRAYELFDELKIGGLGVGRNMAGCHKPETMEKLKKIYQDFADRKIKIHYLTMEGGSEGTLTVVNVPFYDGEALGGVMEMVFEQSLA
ncbi:MAG: hypothetical protein R2940_07695 [Syntrophotaleaceae bacterium]